MTFIGKDMVPAPRLKETYLSKEEYSRLYLEVLNMMRILYQDCKLIHGDLS